MLDEACYRATPELRTILASISRLIADYIKVLSQLCNDAARDSKGLETTFASQTLTNRLHSATSVSL